MKWYFMLAAIVIIFCACFGSIYVRVKRKHRQIPEETSTNLLNERLLLSNIGDNIMKCKGLLAYEDFDALMAAYRGLEDCLQHSDPFGKTQRPTIAVIENQVNSKMSEINKQVNDLQYAGAQQRVLLVSIITSLEIVKSFLLNKERLLLS